MRSKPTSKELERRVKALEKEVSELKNIEEVLLETRKQLADVQRIAHAGLFVWNLRTNEIEWSPEVFRIFGLDPQKFKPDIESVMSRFIEDDMKLNEKLIEAAQEGNEPYSFEARILWPDGSLRHLISTSEGIFDDKQNLMQIIGTVRDITDQVEIEEKLRKSEAKFRDLVENINDVIYSADVNGEITYISPSIKSVMGYDPSEIIGNNFSKYIHPDDLPYTMERLSMVISGELSPTEYRILSKSGEYRWVRSSSRPIYTDDKLVGLTGMFIDITERKRLESQLTQAQKMESIGRLAGGVAHDFNNMLGVILGRTEMILMGMRPEDSNYEELQEIYDAALRSANLTRQLLAFARKQTISPKILDLNDTVEELLKMLRRLIGEDIDLLWKPETHIWPVKMDPAQVDQILANLCVNARDAISGTGKVTIETDNVVFDEVYCSTHVECKPGDFIMLAVSDDGCGMDKETLNNLFEPFFTTKKAGEGTGLGLATIYGIVKQNEGFIYVYSEPKRGSTFKIYMPRTQEAVEEIGEPDVKPVAKGNETVLFVEDENAILNLGKDALEHFGYTVLAAHTPGEALGMAERYEAPIHLLITDVVMPEMNGKELSVQIKKVKPDIKVLFMSGYTGNVIVHRGILEGDVNFLQKPFSINSLAGKVREILDQ